MKTKNISKEKLHYLQQIFKYNKEIEEYLKKDSINNKDIQSIYKDIYKYYKKPIPKNVINLFYDEPKNFFSQFKQYLTNTSLFSISGISIFSHYFIALNENKKDIYEQNFTNFFGEFGKYLDIQDTCLDTALHYLVKKRNKKLFFQICRKLFNMGLLTEEILLIENCKKECCYNIIINEIINNKKNIIRNELLFQLYKEFLDYYPNLKNNLPKKQKLIIIAFLSKVFIDEANIIDNIDINEAINSLITFLYNLDEKKEIFKSLYNPDSGNNILNILFEKSFSIENFEKLLVLVSELSKIKINKSTNEQPNDKYDLCVINHFGYVLKNMRIIKTKGDLLINYGIQLLQEILPLLILNNKSDELTFFIYEKESESLYIKNKKITLIKKNQSISNSLINNQKIDLNMKIDIFKKYLAKYNIEIKLNEENISKNFLLFYLFIHYDENKHFSEITGYIEKFKDIFEDFYFIGLINLEIDNLCRRKNNKFLDEFRNSLNHFFDRNYLDLFSIYKHKYGLSDDKLKILLDYITLYIEDYFVSRDKDFSQINDNKNANYEKIIAPFNIWYSKYILTEIEVFRPFINDIISNKSKYENIESYGKEMSKYINEFYDNDFLLTFLRLFMIIKYNFDEVSQNPDLITCFNQPLGKYYLTNNKKELTNLFSLIDNQKNNDCLEYILYSILDNPESLFLFIDEKENEFNQQLEQKKIELNFNTLQKISKDANQIINIKNESFKSYMNIYGKNLIKHSTEMKNVDNICKFISLLKKQKKSLVKCINDNIYFFKNIFCLLIKYYNYLFSDYKKSDLFQNKIDIIFEEINTFIFIYKKDQGKYSKINFGKIFEVFDNFFDNKFQKIFISNLNYIKWKILNNFSDINYSKLEADINKNIFIYFYFIVYCEKTLIEDRGEEDKIYSLNFSKYNKNILDFFFNEFLSSINPNLSKKYSLFSSLFYDYININKNNSYNYRNETIFGQILNEEHKAFNNFFIIMIYIYLNKTFSNYNHFLLIYIYNLIFEKEKSNEKFIEIFINIIKSKKSNDIEKNLFLIKNQDIPKNLLRNVGDKLIKKNNQNLIINNLLIIFMNNYLLDMNYSSNSLAFYFIQNFSLNANIDVIRSIIFNYPFNDNDQYNKNFYYELVNKYLTAKRTIYEFLKQEFLPDITNEEKMIKRIKILENIFRNFLEEINMDNRDQKKLILKWQNYSYANWYLGLYTFLKVFKKEKKNIISFLNNNIFFIKDFIFTFFKFNKCLLLQKIHYPNVIKEKNAKELNEKIELILQGIHEIFINLLSSKEFSNIIQNMNADEDTEESEEVNDLFKNIFELIKFYTKVLYDKMSNINYNNKLDTSININFEQYLSIISNLPKILSRTSFGFSRKLFAFLFNKDINKFFSLLKIFVSIKNDEPSVMIEYLLRTNIEKFVENYSKIKSIFKCEENWYNDLNESKKRNLLIYILNDSLPNIFSKLYFVNNSSIFNDVDQSYALLRDILNKESSLFIIKKLENIFNKSKVENIIYLMDKVIYNEHVINYLFNSLKENDIKELIKSGKYINNIIKALFRFTEINGYLLIKQLLFLIKKYSPSFDIKLMLLPPDKEPYENMVDLEEIYPNILDEEEEKEEEEDKEKEEEEENKVVKTPYYIRNKKKDYDEFKYIRVKKKKNKDKNKNNKDYYKKMRYLLFYALYQRIIVNYETIAVLLDYCPLEEGIHFLMKELFDENIDNLFDNNHIKFIEYFLNPINKNKIKDIGKNFYNFFNFVESVLNQRDYIMKLPTDEKYICTNYIKIFLLEVVPKELDIFLDNEKEKDYFEKNKNKYNNENSLLFKNENKLMILLTLYEIKGNPILSVKKSYPIYYSKIEADLNKCKSLNINSFNIKKESDTNKLNKIKNILLNDYNCFVLWRYNFQMFPNFMNLIEIRKNPNYQNKYESILSYEYSLEKLFLDLLKNKNIDPIYKTKDIKLFYNFILNRDFDFDLGYKLIIDSLLDFKQSCKFILQKTKIDIFNENNNLGLSDPEKELKSYDYYKLYLKDIGIMCNQVLSKCDKDNYNHPNIFIENLESQNKNKLNTIKKTIDLNEITLNYFESLEKYNPDKKEFYSVLKIWANNYLKKNDVMKEYNKLFNEQNNLLSYFKYLKLSCYILLHFIETIEKNDEDALKFKSKFTSQMPVYRYFDYNLNFSINKKFKREELIIAFIEIEKEINGLFKNPDFGSYEYMMENKKLKTIIPLYFYFDEKKEKFIESFEDEYPYKYKRENFIVDYLWERINFNKDIKSNNKIIIKLDENPLKNYLYNKLEPITFYGGIKVGEKNINFFKKEFEPYFNKYNNYLTSFFQNISEIKLYPNYQSFLSEIINEFKSYCDMYLFPSLVFNRHLSIFLNNLSYVFTNDNVENCETYVDCNELIRVIHNNKYHTNEKFDSLFKTKAINYVLNDNSNINYFIQEIFSIIYNKQNKREKIITSRRKNVKEFFTIKIEGGKTFDINDAKKILIRESLTNLNNNFFIEKNNNKIFNKDNSKIFYSVLRCNPFKRKAIPNVNYKGNVPLKLYRCGINKEQNIIHAFHNYTIIMDKYRLLSNIDKNKKKKVTKKEQIEFINVFELMFSIKSVENNVITLRKNDVSKIVKNYAKDDNTFFKFISHNFSDRNKENIFIDWNNITFNWKYN